MADLLRPEYRSAAADIQLRLAGIREHMLTVHGPAPGMPAARFRALLTGYDIYARILTDAILSIAEGPGPHHRDRHPPAPSPATGDGLPDVD